MLVYPKGVWPGAGLYHTACYHTQSKRTVLHPLWGFVVRLSGIKSLTFRFIITTFQLVIVGGAGGAVHCYYAN